VSYFFHPAVLGSTRQKAEAVTGRTSILNPPPSKSLSIVDPPRELMRKRPSLAHHSGGFFVPVSAQQVARSRRVDQSQASLRSIPQIVITREMQRPSPQNKRINFSGPCSVWASGIRWVSALIAIAVMTVSELRPALSVPTDKKPPQISLNL